MSFCSWSPAGKYSSRSTTCSEASARLSVLDCKPWSSPTAKPWFLQSLPPAEQSVQGPCLPHNSHLHSDLKFWQLPDSRHIVWGRWKQTEDFTRKRAPFFCSMPISALLVWRLQGIEPYLSLGQPKGEVGCISGYLWVQTKLCLSSCFLLYSGNSVGLKIFMLRAPLITWEL